MIIALSGPIASGKSEVARYLQSKGFEIIKMSDIARKILNLYNIEVNRDNIRKLTEHLRNEYGKDILALLSLRKIKKDAIIDGVRTKEEAILLKNKNAILIYIDAPLKLRYERAKERGREGEGKMNFDKFKEEDEADFQMGLKNVKELADYVIINDKTKEDLIEKIENIISSLSQN